MTLKLKISAKNTKLGKIPSFSMSAKKTCPNKTPWCEKHCYATKLERLYPNVKNAYAVNYKATQKVSFVNSMVREIKNSDTDVFRMHVSGDFFNVKYIYSLFYYQHSVARYS